MGKAKKLKRNDMRVTYSGTYGMRFSSKVIRSVKCAAMRTQQQHGAVVSVPGCFCVCRDLSIQTEIRFYYSSFRYTCFFTPHSVYSTLQLAFPYSVIMMIISVLSLRSACIIFFFRRRHPHFRCSAF